MSSGLLVSRLDLDVARDPVHDGQARVLLAGDRSWDERRGLLAGSISCWPVRVTSHHILEQVMTVALKVLVLVITVVDLLESVHVHLAHEAYGLLGVELVACRLEVVRLEVASVQINSLAVARPSKTELILLVVYQIPQSLGEQFLVSLHSAADRSLEWRRIFADSLYKIRRANSLFLSLSPLLAPLSQRTSELTSQSYANMLIYEHRRANRQTQAHNSRSHSHNAQGRMQGEKKKRRSRNSLQFVSCASIRSSLRLASVVSCAQLSPFDLVERSFSTLFGCLRLPILQFSYCRVASFDSDRIGQTCDPCS